MARAVETLVWWVVLVAVWITTLSSPNAQDLVAAAVTGLVCAYVATVVGRVYRKPWKLTKAWKTLVMSAWPATVVLDDREDSLRVHTLRDK